MAVKKILVTGANGQLGSELREASARYPQYDFCFTDQETLSITNKESVAHFFDAYKPDYCINCAAYTAVDKAEDPAELTTVTRVNADAVGFLASACEKNNTRFIHISTDYVFDGTATSPYPEEAATHPVSVYGATKLLGEQLAMQHTQAVVIRTAWVYSTYGKNFVKTMLQLMTTKTSLNVVADQYGAPTYAADLANAIMNIIEAEPWQPGIYHYTNEGNISWYDFAVAIKNHMGSGCTLHPVPTSGYPTAAKRPGYSVLDKSKITATYALSIPHWQDSLISCLQKMKL